MSFSAAQVLSIGERVKPPEGGGMAGRNATGAIPSSVDVAVIGAGIVGLCVAWRLARRELAVAVVDRSTAGSGASFAATGMLAAAAELEPGGSDLLALCLESQRLWPEFRDELEAASGLSIDYRDEGTLLVALGREEVERLRFRHDLQRRSGVAARWVNGSEARAIEPGLRPSATAGILCPNDHQVDPRRVIPALQQALAGAGGHLIEHAAAVLDQSGGCVTGVRVRDQLCRASVVVIATGAWAASDKLLPSGLTIPVRPLKGQALALRSRSGTAALAHVVWTEQVHLAPKADGRLIVGATVEECGFDPAVTAGGVYALLEGARRALPSIEEMELEAVWTGFRPTSDDDAPIIGAAPLRGLLIATGHHRNGILLAPVTARTVEDLVVRGEVSGAAASFGLDRFDRSGSSRIRNYGGWS
jgi:glycine oxidase